MRRVRSRSREEAFGVPDGSRARTLDPSSPPATLLRTSSRFPSTAVTAARLVIGVLVALVLLPPALVALFGYAVERHRAADQAVAVAWALSEGLTPGASLLREMAQGVPAQPQRQEGHQGHQGQEGQEGQQGQDGQDGKEGQDPQDPQERQARLVRQPGWIALVDAQGLVQQQSGPPLAWPTLEATHELRGSPAGAVRMGTPVHERAHMRVLVRVLVARPLGPVLAHTALTALGAAGLAMMLWWLVFRRPVSRLEHAEGQIRSFALQDNLTGLLNREGLRERIARALARAGPQGTAIGLVVLDLDRFNLVNGTLGQAGGDVMLRGVADRLRGVIRSTDALARITGDQFVVLVERISSPQVLAAMARNMLRAFESPFVLDGRDLVVSFSAGGVLTSQDAATVDDLLRQAGAAMRAAKAAGGARFQLYTPEMDDGAQQRLDLDLRLRRALTAGQFFLMYQPIVNAESRHVIAVEALLRWASPERGVVSPADFIPVLEQTGLIVPVGHWVLHEACRRAVQWRQEGLTELVLSVNISPRQFAEADFVQRVRGMLLGTGFPAANLQLEVTEGLLLEPTPQTLRRIGELAGLGVRLAVDDFGMGYSSLAYLKSYPLHGLKIDRMFVRDIGLREQDLAIVRAIVDLGHSLGLKVTAEGVETEEQSEALRLVGCDALQGFLFARPTAADDLALADAVQAPVAEPAFVPGTPAPATV